MERTVIEEQLSLAWQSWLNKEVWKEDLPWKRVEVTGQGEERRRAHMLQREAKFVWDLFVVRQPIRRSEQSNLLHIPFLIFPSNIVRDLLLQILPRCCQPPLETVLSDSSLIQITSEYSSHVEVYLFCSTSFLRRFLPF